VRRTRRNNIKPGKGQRIKLRQRVENEARHGFVPVAVALLRTVKDPDDEKKVVSLMPVEENEMLGDLLAKAALKLG